MDDAEWIRELYRKYWQYMIEKNADGLRSLMTDDYTLLHMTGVKQSAEAFLKGLLDGTFNYYSAEHDSIPRLAPVTIATFPFTLLKSI